MKVYHQAGFRTVWNIESLIDDKVGDGLIWSPVNETLKNLKSLPTEIRSQSFLDPQLYLPHDPKGKLATYGYSPEELSPKWKTSDFETLKYESAKRCLDIQRSSGFAYDVIPSRYSTDVIASHYENAFDEFIEPFLLARATSDQGIPLLLTVIAKRIQIIDEQTRNELLNWITGHREISGVYIIFDAESSSKQIKDSIFLDGALRIISALRKNQLEVHIGYCNTEAILYSIADPTSVTIGSYENLRKFSIGRFEVKEKGGGRSPNPRLYVGGLLQWVEYGYVGALDRLIPEWKKLRHNNCHEVAMFTPSFQWHFMKPQLYKHYFAALASQIRMLDSDLPQRTSQVTHFIDNALAWFEAIRQRNILLDAESDGSHLPHWRNAIAMYQS